MPVGDERLQYRVREPYNRPETALRLTEGLTTTPITPASNPSPISTWTGLGRRIGCLDHGAGHCIVELLSSLNIAVEVADCDAEQRA